MLMVGVKDNMDKPKGGKKGYLFSVDILVEGYSNGIALETLIHILNTEKIKDYKIGKGIELGKIIDAAVTEKALKAAEAAKKAEEMASAGTTDGAKAEPAGQEGPQNIPKDTGLKEGNKHDDPHSAESKENADKAETPKGGGRNLPELIEEFKAGNTLVRLTILKGKGVKLSIPCRILNLDSGTGMLTVYHVDEKKVYQFWLTEVDDFSVHT